MELTLTLGSLVKLCGIGIIAAGTMVIPGVSGSMMLVLLGYYNPIINTLNQMVRALFALDGAAFLQNLGIIVPYGIGLFIGIFAVAKLVEIVLKKFPMYAYWSILGLILASPVAILMSPASSFGIISVLPVLVSAVTFAVGFAVAYKLGD